MYRSNIFAAAIACASAVVIESETEAEFWSNPFGSRRCDPFTDGFGCSGHLPDIDLPDDAFSLTREKNWDVFSYTFAEEDVRLLRGDPDEAIAMWGNSDHYIADYWEEVERI